MLPAASVPFRVKHDPRREGTVEPWDDHVRNGDYGGITRPPDGHDDRQRHVDTPVGHVNVEPPTVFADLCHSGDLVTFRLVVATLTAFERVVAGKHHVLHPLGEPPLEFRE